MRILIDRTMRYVIVTVGMFVVLLVLLLVGYLGKESQFAFNQKYGFGYRFALKPDQQDGKYEIEQDPLSSLLKANQEGADGVDPNEEVATFPTIEEVRASAYEGYKPAGAIGTTLANKQASIDPNALYKDDWRPPLSARDSQDYFFYAYASPDWKEDQLELVWKPEEPLDPNLVPFRLRLHLVSGQQNTSFPKEGIDLKASPSGTIKLPTLRAMSDDERTKGYLFKLSVEPTTNAFMATIGNVFKHSWDGTLTYPRFGIWPLLGTTLLISFVALLIATPISITLAVFLSDIAANRIREILKPIIELLASVPTVVLGYFGLSIIAPGIFAALKSTVFQPESGRMLLTAAVVMAILLVPIITTYTEDAMKNVPHNLRDGGEALGLTRFETLRKIIVPAAKSGILGAVLLGLSRAFGETMIIWMLGGGTASTPNLLGFDSAAKSLAASSRGVADAIAIDMANVTFEEPHYGHLFLLGLILFLTTLAINLFGYKLANKGAKHA